MEGTEPTPESVSSVQSANFEYLINRFKVFEDRINSSTGKLFVNYAEVLESNEKIDEKYRKLLVITENLDDRFTKIEERLNALEGNAALTNLGENPLALEAQALGGDE